MHARLVTFVRHGQCVANAEHRVVGQLDSPLTELGRRQADAAASGLVTRTDVTRVIASDLSRARETGAAIARALGLALELDAALREQSLGEMEGRLAAELAAVPDAEVPGHLHEIRWGGGESVADVHARLSTFLTRLDAEASGSVVLVTHGHAAQIGAACVRGLGPRDVTWDTLPNGAALTLPWPRATG